MKVWVINPDDTHTPGTLLRASIWPGGVVVETEDGLVNVNRRNVIDHETGMRLTSDDLQRAFTS